MTDTAWLLVLLATNLVGLSLIAFAVVWYLQKIRDAVATANGILLGGLAERQEASIVDLIPVEDRTDSQQGYVDRRDASDRKTRTAELQDDFDRGGTSGEGG